jgi:protease I
MNALNQFRVAVIATDGFEEVELTETVKALKDAGAQVDVISTKPGMIQAFRHHDKSIQVKVDRTISEVRPSDYDGLLLPGGALNADELRSEEKVLDFVKQFNESQKPIAAICHAPWILASAGLLEGRMVTSYYSIKDDLKNAGAHWADQNVVVDRNLVTSRSPKDIPSFNREMIKVFSRSSASVIQVAESA